jgi:lantibiotic modifying enzyme
MMPIGWTPTITGKRKGKAIELIRYVADELEKQMLFQDTSLHVGQAGFSIFWEYYHRYSKNGIYQIRSQSAINSALASITNKPLPFTFCNGVTGILWTYSHLEEMGAVKLNLDEIISDDVEDFIIAWSKSRLTFEDYDYLHGSLGACLYLLNRINKDNAKKALEESINLLNEIAHVFPEGITWKWTDPITGMDGYNLGLSHGMPSIIILLSRILQAGVAPKVTYNLLKKSIEWVLDKKNETNFSCFPTAINETDNQYSRLGWCYGDLGIAMSFIQAGLNANNDTWIKEGTNIALHSSHRRNLDQNGVRDAGLCHGSAGIAHIYNRLFHYTGETELKSSSEYWFEKTFSFFDSINNLKAYRINPDTKEGYWDEEYGILEGLAGIGLALISGISTVEPRWDRSLLLS